MTSRVFLRHERKRASELKELVDQSIHTLERKHCDFKRHNLRVVPNDPDYPLTHVYFLCRNEGCRGNVSIERHVMEALLRGEGIIKLPSDGDWLKCPQRGV